MDYSSIFNYFANAVNMAMNNVINNSYPSTWSKNGCGWQEQWSPKAEFKNLAGVYASCEGIIMLADTENELKGLRNTVYEEHLCNIFNVALQVEDYTNRRIRGRSLFTTYKLSHFLHASSCISISNKYKSIIERAMNNLYANYIVEQKMFAPSNKKEFACILATSEALVALESNNGLISYNDVIFNACIEQIENFLYSYDYSNQHDSISAKVIVLWTISYLDKYFDKKAKVTASKYCAGFANILSDLKYKRHTVKFSVRYDDIEDDKDYYSLNIQLKLLDAMITFIEKGYIEKDFFKILFETLLFIADMINQKGYYSTLDSNDKVEFWENYQAIELLKHCNALVSTIIKSKGDDIMIVSPKIFRETVFRQDANLVFVIMPFEESWSNAVYQGFKDALEPNGYTVARADLITNDDVIIQTIWEQINKAKFIIADCTGKNPNVFYELGIAHVIGKPVFMCAQSESDFPFDINHIRYFVYGTSYMEMQDLKKKIKKFAENV